MHKSNSLITEDLRLRIRCAELDTRIRDFVVTLLEHELSGDVATKSNGVHQE